jgi:hypothetical protein
MHYYTFSEWHRKEICGTDYYRLTDLSIMTAGLAGGLFYPYKGLLPAALVSA